MNNFNGGPKSKLETTRGTKCLIFILHFQFWKKIVHSYFTWDEIMLLNMIKIEWISSEVLEKREQGKSSNSVASNKITSWKKKYSSKLDSYSMFFL